MARLWLSRELEGKLARGREANNYMLSLHKPERREWTFRLTGRHVSFAVWGPADAIAAEMWHALEGPRLKPGEGPVRILVARPVAMRLRTRKEILGNGRVPGKLA